jgi:hypothetical protein
VIPLTLVTPHEEKQVHGVLGLDPFGHDLFTQPVGELDDSMDDVGVGIVVNHIEVEASMRERFSM